jgi:hypothetical protein
MPQFDKITFFTQIFWLTLIFFGLYFFILQALLPKLAAILKSRKKKLWAGSSASYRLGEEQLLANNVKTKLLQEFTEKNKSKLNSKLLLSMGWLTLCLLKSTKSQLKNAQSKYLEIYGNTFIECSTCLKMLKN